MQSCLHRGSSSYKGAISHTLSSPQSNKQTSPFTKRPPLLLLPSLKGGHKWMMMTLFLFVFVQIRKSNNNPLIVPLSRALMPQERVSHLSQNRLSQEVRDTDLSKDPTGTYGGKEGKERKERESLLSQKNNTVVRYIPILKARRCNEICLLRHLDIHVQYLCASNPSFIILLYVIRTIINNLNAFYV